MAVITISHQIGSCGREIGQAIAQRLNLDYIDKQVVQAVAKQLGISEQTATSMDEKAQSATMRILSALSAGSGLMIVPPDVDLEVLPDAQQYFQATRQAIEAAALTNRVVIAGHGANFALAGKPGVFNIYFHAPKEQRIATIMARDNISHDEAAKQVLQNDHDRSHYIKTYYNAHWNDAGRYHLAIDTGVIPPKQAVDVITSCLLSSVTG